MRYPVCVALLLIAGPAVAKECRMPDLPPGVQAVVPPECRGTVKTRVDSRRQGVLGAENGFVDLGNGTRVRMERRVRAEVGVRR